MHVPAGGDRRGGRRDRRAAQIAGIAGLTMALGIVGIGVASEVSSSASTLIAGQTTVTATPLPGQLQPLGYRFGPPFDRDATSPCAAGVVPTTPTPTTRTSPTTWTTAAAQVAPTPPRGPRAADGCSTRA